MKLILFAGLLLSTPVALQAQAPALPRSAPEAQGVPSARLLAFLEAAEAKIDALHSFMLLRHGQVVAEGYWSPYQKSDPHMLYSLSKSFTSTAVGLAVAEGRLSLDDSVLAAFPEAAPDQPSNNLKALRVRDLLAMSSGHHDDDLQKFSFSSNEVLTKAFLALPVAHKPGTHFLYNTPGSYMLSALVQKATGQTLLDYLGPRLFEPLGIVSATWEASQQGVSMGGFGLKARTEDIARFGQLYLQKGLWRGQRLLPEAWVAAASARQTSNGSSPTSDWEQGYGYQFWRCRHGLYRGDGALGQFCIVMPEQDAVVAITSGTRDMQGVMNLVWEHVLGALAKDSLPPDAAAALTLERKLAGLSLRPQAGQPSSPLARQVAGRTYTFPPNDDRLESVRLEVGASGTTLVVRAAGREDRVACGAGSWRRGSRLVLSGVDQPVAASGGWTAGDTYTAKLCAYESPFTLTAKLQFKGEELVLDREFNVALGSAPLERPQLVGKR